MNIFLSLHFLILWNKNMANKQKSSKWRLLFNHQSYYIGYWSDSYYCRHKQEINEFCNALLRVTFINIKLATISGDSLKGTIESKVKNIALMLYDFFCACSCFWFPMEIAHGKQPGNMSQVIFGIVFDWQVVF